MTPSTTRVASVGVGALLIASVACGGRSTRLWLDDAGDPTDSVSQGGMHVGAGGRASPGPAAGGRAGSAPAGLGGLDTRCEPGSCEVPPPDDTDEERDQLCREFEAEYPLALADVMTCSPDGREPRCGARVGTDFACTASVPVAETWELDSLTRAYRRYGCTPAAVDCTKSAPSGTRAECSPEGLCRDVPAGDPAP